MKYSHNKNESGISLVATLWIVVILTAVATEFLYSIHLEQRAKDNFVERTKLFYAARAGLEETITKIRDDETPYDALSEEWASDLEGEIEESEGQTKTLKYKVKVTDELSKININEADEEMIQKLLALAGVEDETLAQTCAQAVTAERDKQKFRTVGDLARVLAGVEGITAEMATEMLYGSPETQAGEEEEEEAEESDMMEETATPLAEIITVYAADKNVDAEGQNRVNINSANQQQLSQVQGENGQQILSQGEAQSIIDQRDQQQYNNIGELVNTPAVSQNMFNNIRNQISVDDQENRVNINSASTNELQSLDGIDNGVAEDIIRYRNEQGQFNNVDDIQQAKVVNSDDMSTLADKLTTTDEQAVQGKININTASETVLALLPGMDEEKAGAIVQAREANQAASTEEEAVPGFENTAQLLEVEGIDQNTFGQIAGVITCRSYTFMIEAHGVGIDGKDIGYCMAIIDRTGDSIEIKMWRQR